jgi:hypothetical protein
VTGVPRSYKLAYSLDCVGVNETICYDNVCSPRKGPYQPLYSGSHALPAGPKQCALAVYCYDTFFACFSVNVLASFEQQAGAVAQTTTTTTTDVSVQTNRGVIVGSVVTNKKGKTPVNVFLGVPFAAPPVGARRFLPPVPPQPWTTALQTKWWKPACAQPKGSLALGKIAEDCLYLNVFAPRRNATRLLPVIVFLYGGSWQRGDAGVR